MINTIVINLISLLGLTGFLLSRYIYLKKKSKKKLICPMRSNCDTVIHSDYSKIFGISVEVLGMVYYLIIAFSYSLVFVFNLWSMPVAMVLVGLSACALLFSIYLVSLQAFIVKHWCFWCLSSGIISLIIFLLSYLNIVLS